MYRLCLFLWAYVLFWVYISLGSFFGFISPHFNESLAELPQAAAQIQMLLLEIHDSRNPKVHQEVELDDLLQW